MPTGVHRVPFIVPSSAALTTIVIIIIIVTVITIIVITPIGLFDVYGRLLLKSKG